jgi:hypothetical protein
MKKTIGILAVAAIGLHAQGVGVGAGRGRGGAMMDQFQETGTISLQGVMPVMVNGGRNQNLTVTGKPVSGTEQHSSKQTLGDGTVIATSQSDVFYRDGAGRTRVETPSQNRVVITDPVAGYSITLNTETKTARKMSMTPVARPAIALTEAMRKADGIKSSNSATATYTTTVTNSNGVTTTVTGGGPVAAVAGELGGVVVRAKSTLANMAQNMKHEDLGVQSLNNVLAAGSRDTETIPQGQIGNDRDIHVTNERWYSDDLQMLVKTVNSDPRFGENSYEFTNVDRAEPDPTLFQIPGDYTVSEGTATFTVQKKE